MGNDSKKIDAFVEISDTIKNINIFLHGYICNNFLENNESCTLSIDFTSGLTEKDEFEFFRKWVLNAFSPSSFASAKITTPFSRYSLESIFPISVEMNSIDDERHCGSCTAKIAYSLITEEK